VRTSVIFSNSERALAVPPSFQRRVLFWLGLAVGYWALIFTLTHVPGSVGGVPRVGDKTAHALAYFGLAVLLCSAYSAWRPGAPLGYLGVFVAVAAYGAIDEITQGLVPFRQPDFLDWLADVGGAACGVGFMFLVAAFWPARWTAAAAASAASADVSTR
jgi:VanZ family protein